MPEKIIYFNGTKYCLLSGGRYYLSYSTKNSERQNPKGLHVAVWEFYSGKKVPDGHVIHHKDHNTLNNNFENLECIRKEEHLKIHKENRLAYSRSEKCKKHLAKIRPLASAWHKSDAGKKWHKEHATNLDNVRITVKCPDCGIVRQTNKSTPRERCTNCHARWMRKQNPEHFREIERRSRAKRATISKMEKV